MVQILKEKTYELSKAIIYFLNPQTENQKVNILYIFSKVKLRILTHVLYLLALKISMKYIYNIYCQMNIFKSNNGEESKFCEYLCTCY